MKGKKGGLISKIIIIVAVVFLVILIVLKFPQEGKRIVKEMVDLGKAVLDLVIKIGELAIKKLININK